MATFTRLNSGNWRVQIRRKGHVLSRTFLIKKDAEAWGRRIEIDIDKGKVPADKSALTIKTVADLIDLHIADMAQVGKKTGRSKQYSLDLIKDRLGSIRLDRLDRAKLIEFGKARARQGAGPVTLSIDFGYIRTLISHGAAIHGLALTTEHVDLARIALVRLGLIGKAKERNRRPTKDEISALLTHFDDTGYTSFPLARIIKFAITSAMRLGEICRVEWAGIDIAP